MPTLKLTFSQTDIIQMLAKQYDVDPKSINVRVWGPNNDDHVFSPGGFEIEISSPDMKNHPFIPRG